MAIDISALKKFQDQWTPVLAAIPAVIDAAAQQNDIERNIAGLKKELAKLNDSVAKAQAEAEQQIAALKADVDLATQDRQRKVAEIGNDKHQLSLEFDSYKQKTDEQKKEIAGALKTLEAQVHQAELAYNSKVLQLDSDYEAYKRDVDEQIKLLDAKRAEAEKALNAIRNKLG